MDCREETSTKTSPSNIIHTTVGELIEAITEVAEQAGRTEREGLQLASFTVEKILREKKQRELLS